MLGMLSSTILQKTSDKECLDSSLSLPVSSLSLSKPILYMSPVPWTPTALHAEPLQQLSLCLVYRVSGEAYPYSAAYCILTAVAPPALYEKLGHQWATSVLAFLSLVMASFP